MPTTEVPAELITDGKVALLDLLTLGKLAPSRSEAKRLVMQGGVFVGEEKASSFSQTIDADALKDGIIIKKGKKVFHRFITK